MLNLNKGQASRTILDLSDSINTFIATSTTTTKTSRTFMSLLTGIPLTYSQWNVLSPQQRVDMCTIGDVAASKELIASMSRYGDSAITTVGSTITSNEPSLDIDFRQFDRSLATVVGTPTWFILHSVEVSISGASAPSTIGTVTYQDSGTLNAPRGFSVIGTVGAVGSGADMELLHTTFVIGQETALDKQQILFNRGFV